MGLMIYLQDEDGERRQTLSDERNLVHRQLTFNDGSILSGIDWYGDTVFNNLQMRQFVPAWEAIIENATDPDERMLVNEILALAKEVQHGVHLYLKFEGD
jgi:hypothetical protein